MRNPEIERVGEFGGELPEIIAGLPKDALVSVRNIIEQVKGVVTGREE